MISIDLDHFRQRVLQDALTSSLADHWEARARVFDLVNPEETPLSLIADDSTVALASSAAQTALACRRHAHLIRCEGLPDFITAEITDVLDEVA